MNFVFKIFGAPYGFELNQGTQNEQNYFQTFDNGSTEKTKLVIHRMASGQVSYSYLCYKFKTSGGRDNSFFGMSVVFNKEYCTDIKNLYALFESVYETIVQNGILLEQVKGNPAVQAKYLVSTFAEAETEVKRIENIVSRNIEKEFANDIRPLDSSFEQGNPNLIRKLNDKKENSAFLTAIRKYSWVYISPDYNDEEGLSPQAIAELDEKIEVVQKNIANTSINALKGANVQQDVKIAWEQIQSGINLIKPYLQIQPELYERDKKLNDYQKQLSELNKAVLGSIPNSTPAPNSPISPIPDSDTKSKSTDTKDPKITFWYKHKSLIMVVSGLFVLVALGIVLFPRDDKNNKDTTGQETTEITASTSTDSTEKLIQEGNDALQNNNFDTAIEIFKQAGKVDLANNAKDKAKEYWSEKAVESGFSLLKQKEYLENVKKYGGYPSTDNDIAEVQKQIDDANVKKETVVTKNVTAGKQKIEKASNNTAEVEKNKNTSSQNNNAATDCTIHKKFDSDNSKQSWTVADLLKEAKKKLDAGSTTIAKDMCQAIIEKQKGSPACATKDQLDKAKSYISRANTDN